MNTKTRMIQFFNNDDWLIYDRPESQFMEHMTNMYKGSVREDVAREGHFLRDGYVYQISEVLESITTKIAAHDFKVGVQLAATQKATGLNDMYAEMLSNGSPAIQCLHFYIPMKTGEPTLHLTLHPSILASTFAREEERGRFFTYEASEKCKPVRVVAHSLGELFIRLGDLPDPAETLGGLTVKAYAHAGGPPPRKGIRARNMVYCISVKDLAIHLLTHKFEITKEEDCGRIPHGGEGPYFTLRRFTLLSDGINCRRKSFHGALIPRRALPLMREIARDKKDAVPRFEMKFSNSSTPLFSRILISEEGMNACVRKLAECIKDTRQTEDMKSRGLARSVLDGMEIVMRVNDKEEHTIPYGEFIHLICNAAPIETKKKHWRIEVSVRAYRIPAKVSHRDLRVLCAYDGASDECPWDATPPPQNEKGEGK